MNARSRKERAILRQRRRPGWFAQEWVALVRRRSLARLHDTGLYLVPSEDLIGQRRDMVQARLRLLFEAFTVGDGIAYVPNDRAGLAGIGATAEQAGPADDVDQEDDDPDTRRGCERGCPIGECYHGEPFLSDFDDPWDGA